LSGAFFYVSKTRSHIWEVTVASTHTWWVCNPDSNPAVRARPQKSRYPLQPRQRILALPGRLVCSRRGRRLRVVYYRGQNDAWVGYGGAVLYTRTPGLSPELVPRLEAASKKAGIDFKDFTVTDNTCKPKEVRESSTAIAVENRLLLNERAIVEEFSSAARFTSSSIKTTEKFAEKSFEKLEV